MKILVTGSLGHISKPLTKELIEKGNQVTIISSNTERKNDIQALGANAAIGSLEDRDFVIQVFSGADAAYCMIPPNNYFDKNLDLLAYYSNVANNYAAAIKQAGIKRVVHLSSIGAHMEKNSGLIIGHHNVEEILKEIPNISLTHLRPTGFYYNMYNYIGSIKNNGIIATNDNPDDTQYWVAPEHIAAIAAEELQKFTEGRNVIYVANDERSGNEIAKILGEAIGKPNLKWVQLSDDQMLEGLKAAGMNPEIAEGFVEMYAKVRTGEMQADYELHKPKEFGKKKLEDFAREFTNAFNENN